MPSFHCLNSNTIKTKYEQKRTKDSEKVNPLSEPLRNAVSLIQEIGYQNLICHNFCINFQTIQNGGTFAFNQWFKILAAFSPLVFFMPFFLAWVDTRQYRRLPLNCSNFFWKTKQFHCSEHKSNCQMQPMKNSFPS